MRTCFTTCFTGNRRVRHGAANRRLSLVHGLLRGASCGAGPRDSTSEGREIGSRKRLAIVSGLLWLAVGAQTAQACPVCFGAADSPLTKGMNLAILALLGVTGVVLGAFAVFFLYLMRRSKAAADGAVSVPRSSAQEGSY